MSSSSVSSIPEKDFNSKKFNIKSLNLDWYRLDNAATLFTLVNSVRIPCMYRVSSTLKNPINVSKLQEALDNIIWRFPYYKVNMRRGLFWYYWETNPKRPLVERDVKYPNQKLDVTKKGVFPFRVRAYQNRIAIEFHHSLSDGTGAMTFLKALVAEYLVLGGTKVTDWSDIFRPNSTPDLEEFEDAFKKNYLKTAPNPQKIANAFQVPFKLDEKGTYHIITGIIPIKEIIQRSKGLNVTLTEYLIAKYLEALQSVLLSFPEKQQKKLTKPIRLQVPVNLRRIFPSKTMRNFSLFVTPGINPRLGVFSFDEILNQVYHYMRVEVSDKYISQQIARNVRGELHPLVRYTPLSIKKLFGKAVYNTMGEKLYSGVITNLGRINIPEEIAEEMEDFQFFPAPSPSNKTGCAVGTFKDKLYINFGRTIKEPVVEKFFFENLVKDGLPVKIETN
ncbi:MAG TPA: hypothetical protein VMX55_15595 [candidate division Zixibacteria bacterium]|nr:hypothetical protein [candidate division Zixibacteria bacterium]